MITSCQHNHLMVLLMPNGVMMATSTPITSEAGKLIHYKDFRPLKLPSKKIVTF